MKKTTLFSASAFLLAASSGIAADPVLAKIPQVISRAEACYTKLTEVAGDSGQFPRTIKKDGSVSMVKAEDWTSGFFPGSLWLLHEATGKAEWKEAAIKHTRAMERIRHFKGNHDTGFMLGCSYGNALRLDPGNAAEYKRVLLDGAKALQTRFISSLGMIRSWDHSGYQCPVIIDNMMNLELMAWSTANGGPSAHRATAESHATLTMKNHFRPDGSAYHVVDYDPKNGAIRGIHACQGMDVRTGWARGQAWAIYGFTMMHRQTGKREYLDRAVATADYVMKHPNLPADKIPYWDFGAKAGNDTPRDASAAAVIASGLIEMSQALGKQKGAPYFALAQQQLVSLSSSAYLTKPGTNGDFLLAHSTGALPLKYSEVDVPLNYADYYFLEALMRYQAVVKGKKRESFGSLR